MSVLFERLIPYRLSELLAVQVVAKSTVGNLFQRQSNRLAICCRGIVVLLLALVNAFNVCFVAVDDLCRATGEGVA